jgi:hypothetical protein
MSTTECPKTSPSRLSDPDMQAAPIALARAAKRAREIAILTGTPLIVVRNGKVVEEMVQPDPTRKGEGQEFDLRTCRPAGADFPPA